MRKFLLSDTHIQRINETHARALLACACRREKCANIGQEKCTTAIGARACCCRTLSFHSFVARTIAPFPAHRERRWRRGPWWWWCHDRGSGLLLYVDDVLHNRTTHFTFLTRDATPLPEQRSSGEHIIHYCLRNYGLCLWMCVSVCVSISLIEEFQSFMCMFLRLVQLHEKYI